MSNNDEIVPLEACALPDIVKVTNPALDYAKQFQNVVPVGCIAAFSWHDGERVKANEDAPWVDNGPGMHLGAYRISQIPEEAVYQSGSLRYAVLIRKEILDQYHEKTIDLNERGNPILR